MASCHRLPYMVNWRSYNESLARRGEVMLDFDVIDGWHDELERINEDKEGESVIQVP
ncbi:MAG TPA: hypothetical protein VNI77_04395 [Nitrososphaera sp.]|nr:hypothetical protein [Nitrososphaera sp.]